MVFEFEKNMIELEFKDGLKFELDPTKISEKIAKYTQRFDELQKNILNNELTEEEVFDEVINAIDEILGEGKCKEIFGKNKINLWHLVDLWCYICDRCAAFHKQKKQKYLNGKYRKNNNNKKR